MVKNKFLLGAAIFAMSFFATSCSDSERPEMKSSQDEPATSMQTADNEAVKYYVCGTKELMGTQYDFGIESQNEMQYNEGEDVFRLVRGGIDLKGGGYLCIVKDSYDNCVSDTAILEIYDNDIYNVTFTFVPDDSFEAYAEKAEKPEPGEPIEVTIPSMGFATFSNVKNAIVPEGLKAYTATYDESSSSMILKEIDEGFIPAGNGVILQGTEGQTYPLSVIDGEFEDLQENALVPTTSKDGSQPSRGPADMVLGMKDGKAAFMKLKDDIDFTPDRAYFPFLTYSENITVNSLSIRIQ